MRQGLSRSGTPSSDKYDLYPRSAAKIWVLVQGLGDPQSKVLLTLRVAFAASPAESIEHRGELGYTCGNVAAKR